MAYIIYTLQDQFVNVNVTKSECLADSSLYISKTTVTKTNFDGNCKTLIEDYFKNMTPPISAAVLSDIKKIIVANREFKFRDKIYAII